MEYDILYPEKEEELHNAECIVAAAYFNEDELISFGVEQGSDEISMPFSDKNEFEKTFMLWDSPLYLKNFYNSNKKLFEADYWKGISVAEFVRDVTHSTNEIKDEFINLFSNNQLQTVVEALDRDDEERRPYQSIRVKIKQGWIHRRMAFRFYAIEIEENKCYVITGSAIKVHKDMMKAPNTATEKAKLEAVLKDLDTQGIDTKESFINYILQIE